MKYMLFFLGPNFGKYSAKIALKIKLIYNS